MTTAATTPRSAWAAWWRRLGRGGRLSARRRRSDLEGRRDPLGPAGEKLAARCLKRSGYLILARNVRVPMGEADIVAVAPDRRTVVIVEVKTRRTGDGDLPPSHRAPEASVTSEKRGKLVLIARHLARANRWKNPPRIDVIAVEWPAAGRPVVRHHVAAVQGSAAPFPTWPASRGTPAPGESPRSAPGRVPAAESR